MKANRHLLQKHVEKAYELEKIIRQDFDVNKLVRRLVASYYLH